MIGAKMTFKTKILGHNISLSKINKCHSCGKTQDLDILERIIDTRNDKMRYTMVTMCRYCNKLNIALYHIGSESKLDETEKECENAPIEPYKIFNE